MLTPTPDQRLAVEAPLGPLLVVAGPGSGKTFCLVARVAHLITRLGVPPKRICAVTFTNKAAEEVAGRLHRALGPAAEEITRGTLHRLCLTVLREHPDAAGLRAGFGVADDEYQRQLLRRLGVRREAVGSLLGLFGRHRLQGVPLHPGDADLLARYCDALRARNLVDFDDIIALAEALLREQPAIAIEQAERWDAILVDEFQDLSTAQYGILRKLAARASLFAVGDDEQSIYSWAGADPRVLERFRTDFVIARPIVLDRNRRCPTRILEVARRLVARNPTLFAKAIESEREGDFDVEIREFEDEAGEADWLIADVIRDQACGNLPWGEIAVLYRRHETGRHLESALLRAGVPCRLARGQALLDDRVIAAVVSALRVIADPDDPVVVEAFAERMLPRAMLEQVRLGADRGADLLGSLRAFARRSHGDPDAKKAWRFIYHVENLRALGRAHDTLAPLVDELLANQLGRYRNPLEERYAELVDPLECPGAPELAERLAAAAERGGVIWIAPDRGVDIAVKGMLDAGGLGNVRRITGPHLVSAGDFVLRPADARPGCWPLVVFKALQILHARQLRDRFRDYVAFDLETTDKDVATCGIVELAAVRVRGGVIVEHFSTLMRPGCPISPRATGIHGYRDRDVRDAPLFAEVWPRFREFVGSDVLVAHNAQEFDVPVLRRHAAGMDGAGELAFFDTLPLARSLLDASASLRNLAHRFGVDAGRSHHALDDARTLVGVLRHLGELKVRRARTAAAVQTLGHLGLALTLHATAEPAPEEALLRELALPAALGRYGNCLECYAAEREAAPGDAPPVEELVERLGGQRLMDRLRAQRSPAERYPVAVARLAGLVAASAAPSLEESIGRLLDLVALSSSDGVERDPDRLSLLTLHSTKGLEFSRVYVVGVEDNQMPGYAPLRDGREADIQEARRLLYVGMTRAKDRLVLTRVRRRNGRSAGGDMFLREMGLWAGAET
ncbi:MAG TPA: UvrD-helicase domain-containing protein [Gemmatimonadales bacterium]|nr:UvrD-helicase domain-containing protein [Gemmatimonadales bacterium]